ncbi:unnamed protein product [Owenia fusiformis]|uniref:Uncharacterized protein n=1 Tax=Owenia fusiformis TaxID=6347 RepID=A0A8J1XUQ1_OWEFU|nr:unnamed protein product [Owenia fusiformis]
MNEASLSLIKNGTDDETCSMLQDFSSKHAQSFAFPELTRSVKQVMVENIVERLNNNCSHRCSLLCLTCLRLLSREKSGLDTMTTEQVLKTLAKTAKLEVYDGSSDVTQDTNSDHPVVIEAQKCLCNLIFNSTAAQRICSGNGCVEGIVQRLKTYEEPLLPHEIKFYDMRMLFLLTALNADIRPKVRYELHGLTYLIEVLDLILKSSDTQATAALSDQDVGLCCEILKILFNLTVTMDRNNLDEEEEAHFMRLVSVLHNLLLSKTVSKEKQEDLQSHTVNLLTNMPKDCYEELLSPVTEGVSAGLDNKDIEYDGKSMESIVALLAFLDYRLEKPKKILKEALTPILHCMCEMCRANRSIRKFCRTKVLPPLRKEVLNLPEEGPAIRNKLCQLLTSPITEVKELVADFLFVLCKENVGRLVKYTGYGNAAGLLASRGLMCGGRGDGEYSSASDESDTEDYDRLKPKVNPVTGRFEEEKIDPMAGMTEEQKEYEAMKLVQCLDKLHKTGIIQPSTIGEDGKPRAVEHILELTEGINIQPENNSDSDS